MNIAITAEDFDFVAKLIKTEAAITLDKGKEYLVQSRLEPVAKSLGFQNIGLLLDNFKKSRNLEICRKIVESLTTHETSFFRDNEPFEILKNTILPKLIEAQRTTRELTIWCGAASSGQEPYSLCILIRENFPELLNWKLKILASDLSNAILAKAKDGIYSQIEVNRGLPVKHLVKYFEKKGADWIVKPELRQMVEYFEQNLLHPFVRVPMVDLILLRNVLIYFDIDAKRQILSKMRALMRPSAYLMLGAAETTINIDDSFERIAFEKTSCYKKK